MYTHWAKLYIHLLLLTPEHLHGTPDVQGGTQGGQYNSYNYDICQLSQQSAYFLHHLHIFKLS